MVEWIAGSILAAVFIALALILAHTMPAMPLHRRVGHLERPYPGDRNKSEEAKPHTVTLCSSLRPVRVDIGRVLDHDSPRTPCPRSG